MKLFAIVVSTLLFSVSVLACANCFAQASEDAMSQFLSDYDEAVEKANEDGKPIFIYVYDSV